MNRIFILMPCFFFFLFHYVYAEDIYIYKHKNGNIVITNTLIPEEYQKKSQKISSFNAAKPAVQHQQEKEEVKSDEVKSKKTYDPKEVEKEKKYMAEEIKRLKDKESADSNKAQYYRYFIDTYENNLHLLEKDPESYFLKQKQFEKEVIKLLH